MFLRFMYTITVDLPFAAAHLDDIIVVIIDIKVHVSHLTSVLDKISEFRFRISLNDYTLFMNSIKYLGTII